VRLFLALNLGADVRRRCYEATAPLRAIRPELRWVVEPQFHLTLKYLGEQPEAVVAPLSAVVDEVADRSREMDLTIGAVGAFPNFRRARVVYLAVEPDPKLELLHHDVEVSCARMGFPIEGRPFRPHVTIGRERDDADPGARRALRDAARGVGAWVDATVGSVDLMVSEPAGKGHRHRLVHAAPMRAVVER
jgi:2'-5' RNA ligase